MVSNGISVVQVKPCAVKQTKELEDNSQLKDDNKDPKLIVNLVKDGNYGMPYLPEEIYAAMRQLSTFREQLMEDRIRMLNRLHREMTVYFPEYKEALGKFDGVFSLRLLQAAPFPEKIIALGCEGIRQIWQHAKLKGRSYSRAQIIVNIAKQSVGIKDIDGISAQSVQWYVDQIINIDAQIQEIGCRLHNKCKEIPNAEQILAIAGIGENILSNIIAEMGDISRFDNVKEIQKLSGLGLVACSSGKHKGQTKISYRGRKRLRYWLFQAAKLVVAHSDEFRELHLYYTTRAENPLKKMQSLIAIACKLLRVIYTILIKGTEYDPKRLILDIKRPSKLSAQAE